MTTPRSTAAAVPAALVLLLLLVAPACAEQQFAGRVLAVDDGDTVRVQRGAGEVRVRIFGVDAPEATQAYGPEARDVARRLLLDRQVTVVMKDVDQYGRLVASLQVNGRDIGPELIAAGAAWNYPQFSRDDRFAALEAAARRARRGLWALPDPMAPWLFRASARAEGAGASARAGDVRTGGFHGNRRSRVFHAPGCEHYDCANCTATFESVAAAAAAGYRAHTACVR